MFRISNRFLAVAAAIAVCAAGAPVDARAGEGATIIFRSGLVVTLNNGYEQIFSQLKTAKAGPNLVSLNIAGSDFTIDVSEIVVLCRDQCNAMGVMHQLDPKRGAPPSERRRG